MGGLFEYMTIPTGIDTGGTETLFVLRCAFVGLFAGRVILDVGVADGFGGEVECFIYRLAGDRISLNMGNDATGVVGVVGDGEAVIV